MSLSVIELTTDATRYELDRPTCHPMKRRRHLILLLRKKVRWRFREAVEFRRTKKLQAKVDGRWNGKRCALGGKQQREQSAKDHTAEEHRPFGRVQAK